jgi:hypothetical protein
LLCLDALSLTGSAAVPEFLRGQLRGQAFNPFNLVVADGDGGWVAGYAAGRLTLAAMAPGVCVVGNSTPGDSSDAKLARGRKLISVSADLGATLANLQGVLRHHGDADGAGAICVHGEGHGTLSSTILAIGKDFPRASRYLHAAGPPCRTAYEDCSSLLGES